MGTSLPCKMSSMRGMVSHTRRCVSRIMAASSPTSPLISSTRSCTGRSISSVCDTANHERGDGKGLMSPVGSNLCSRSGRSCNSDRISGRMPRVMAWLTKSSMVVDTSMSHMRFCSGAARLNVTPRSVLRLPAAMTIHSAGMPKSSGVSVSWYAAACTAGGADVISSRNRMPAPSAGKKSGRAQYVRPSLTCGIPRRSVGSICAKRRSTTPRQLGTCSASSWDVWNTTSDLPMPDGPRRNVVRLRVFSLR